MNQDFLKQLNAWPKPYITGAALHSLLATKSTEAAKAIIKRSVADKDLLRIKRDLYFIKAMKHINSQFNPYTLAQLIYGPSYISFESALSHYGWIPEAVYTTTSASYKRSREFSTAVGIFSFKKIPTKHFYHGVECENHNCEGYMIATPWRAIADLIYDTHKQWNTCQDLVSDMRIDYDTLLTSNIAYLEQLIMIYPHKYTRKILHHLFEDFKKEQGHDVNH